MSSHASFLASSSRFRWSLAVSTQVQTNRAKACPVWPVWRAPIDQVGQWMDPFVWPMVSSVRSHFEWRRRLKLGARLVSYTYPSSAMLTRNLFTILHSSPSLWHRWHPKPSPLSGPPHLTLSFLHVMHARPFRVTCRGVSELGFSPVDLEDNTGDGPFVSCGCCPLASTS